MNEKRPVVVTTAHRGVFVGYVEEETETTVTLNQARMVVYWPTANRSVMGLATEGPLQGARVSAAVPRLRLRNVTATMDATEQAAKRWEEAPWD